MALLGVRVNLGPPPGEDDVTVIAPLGRDR